LTPAQREKYTALLGVGSGPPGLDHLRALVRAHLTRVPFENISKLWYRATLGLEGLPGIDRYLEGIARYGFGGTCYANNYYLYLLLLSLGYDARLCGADMSRPDVHIVVMVRAGEREFILDGGYAAPFLEPFPAGSAAEVTVSLGNERYVLSPRDARGRSRLAMYRDGLLKHGYAVNPAPRHIEEFRQVIADSFLPSATFMNAVVVARFEEGRSLVLHNRTIIETRGSLVRLTHLGGREEVVGAIERQFGIPSGIASVALPDLERLSDPWG